MKDSRRENVRVDFPNDDVIPSCQGSEMESAVCLNRSQIAVIRGLVITVLFFISCGFVQAEDWIKIYDGGSTNSEIPPISFAFITDNNTIIGWEACYNVVPGSYSEFEVHGQIINNRTSRTNPA